MRGRMLSSITVVLLCSAGLSAQTEVKSKTKVDVKGGKTITTTGCIDRLPDGQYELTGVGGESQYVLIGKDDLADRVGHRVEIRGRASDLGDAKVKTETETTTKTNVKDDDDKEVTRKTTTERKGDLSGARMLRIDSVKTLAKSCE